MYNIYVIKSKVSNHIYVGITTLSIEERFKRHIKHSYDKKHSGLIYQVMRQLGRKNFYIELLEQTNDKSRETLYIESYNNNEDYICCNQNNGAYNLTKEMLYDLYVTQGLASRKIAEKFHIKSKTTILNKLKEYGILERHARRYDLPAEKIYDMHKANMSFRQIAKVFGVDKDVIIRIINEYSPTK